MDKKKPVSKDDSTVDDGIPEAKYTRLGEKIRQAIPGPMQCSMACGGRNCKWENPAKWSDADQAIKGVFSSWVLDDIVAMARPSTETIEKYDFIKQFKEHNICSIINLQRPGEHASCGPPLDKESLFTYRPQDFMDNDIFFYNFGWKDFGVTSLNTILDMVKVMSFALEQGKVAVHCHAGLGRTGVLIACYLVYAYRMEPGSAILRVRKNRSNSIQTRGQIACVHEFSQFLRPLRIVFPQVVPHSKRVSLKQFLVRQNHLLHGYESRELRHTPKLVHIVCNRLSTMVKSSSSSAFSHLEIESMDKPVRRCNTVAEIRETIPGAFVNETEGGDEDLEEIFASSPTDVEAVLSPRVTRRGSGRSRNVSESSNQPSSADLCYQHSEQGAVKDTDKTTDPHNPVATEMKTHSILVQSRSNSARSAADVVDVEGNKDSQITFVKPQSRQGYSLTSDGGNDEESHSTPDDKEDNSPAVETVSSTLNTNTNSNHSSENMQSESVHSITENENNNNSEIAIFSPNESPLPSPKVSPREPVYNVKSLVADHAASIQSAIQTEMPSAKPRKMRISGGMSDTVLPTGSREKRSKSAKSQSAVPALSRDDLELSEEPSNTETKDVALDRLPGEELPTKEGEISNQSEVLEKPAEATDLIEKTDEDLSNIVVKKPMLDYSTLTASEGILEPSPLSLHLEISDNEDVSAEVASCEDIPHSSSLNAVLKQDSCDNDPEPSTDPEPSNAHFQIGDEDLEVIDIDENAGPSFSDCEDEGADKDEKMLNSSIASKLSWAKQADGVSATAAPASEAQPTNDGDDGRQLSAVSKASHGGRSTPLMYRAERNIEMMEERGKRLSDASDHPNHASKSESGSDSGEASPSSAQSVGEPDESLNVEPVEGGNTKPSPNLLGVSSHPIHSPRTSKSMNDLAAAADDVASLSRRSSYGDVPKAAGAQRTILPHDRESIATGFSYKLTNDEYMWEKIYTQQVAINNHITAWRDLANLDDPTVLSSLMWSWLEHLEEPVLSSSDVRQMLDIVGRRESGPTETDRFDRALESIGRGPCCTFRCILDCICSFPPLTDDRLASVVRRTVAALTHIHTPSQDDLAPKLEKTVMAYVLAKCGLPGNVGRASGIEIEIPEEKRKNEKRSQVVEQDCVSDDDGEQKAAKGSRPERSGDRRKDRSAGSIRSTSSSGSSGAGNVSHIPPSIVVS